MWGFLKVQVHLWLAVKDFLSSSLPFVGRWLPESLKNRYFQGNLKQSLKKSLLETLKHVIVFTWLTWHIHCTFLLCPFFQLTSGESLDHCDTTSDGDFCHSTDESFSKTLILRFFNHYSSNHFNLGSSESRAWTNILCYHFIRKCNPRKWEEKKSMN